MKMLDMSDAVLSGKVLLIVEDDKDLLDCYKEMVNSFPIKVYTAGGVDDAMSLLEQGLRPDFFLVDLLMPKKSGWELIVPLRQRFPSAMIIATSGDWSPEVREKSINCGANHFLEKPFGLDRLENLLLTSQGQNLKK